MKIKRKSRTVPTTEQIALMADKGLDILRHFTNRGKKMPARRLAAMAGKDSKATVAPGKHRRINMDRESIKLR